MSYSKTLASFDDHAVINVTGWGKPAIALSQERLQDLISQVDAIEQDIETSKTGIAGSTIHNLHQELIAFLAICTNMGSSS